MSKITVQVVSKAYSGVDLFQGLCMEVHSGTRLALVGPNGCGKSTLLKIMAGETEPDSGKVTVPKGSQIGFVQQELGAADLVKPLQDFVLEVLPSWSGFWKEWRAALEQGDDAALIRLHDRQEELEHQYGYNPEHRAHAILSGLGFSPAVFSRPVGELSGGWRERAKLARVLVAGADILFLDEPTNHLDLEAVEWLETYVLNFEGVLVFVAHDRYFLDRVASKVLFLGGEKPMLRDGNFSQFLEWNAERNEQVRRQAEKLRTEIGKKQAFVDRFRAKATKAKQAQSRLGQIGKLQSELETLTPETRARTLSFSWPEPERGNQTVLSAVDLSFSFPDAALFADLSFNIYRGQKIGLVGPNGRGKSTLIKLINGQLKPGGGRISTGSSIVTGYFSQHQTDIVRPAFTVMSEVKRLASPSCTDLQLKSALGLFMLGERYWEKKVEELSGGEKNRLVLSTLFLSRANFLILDEPTNHLDMESREALMDALSAYQGTMMVVAHDRYLLSEVVSEIWEMHPDGIEVHQCGFDEYHVRKKAREALELEKPDPTRAVRNEQKLKKREQAEMRNRIYQQLKPLRKKYEKLEAELETNLVEQEVLEKKLADPATYEDVPLSRELGQRFTDLQNRAEELMSDLAYLEKELQELEIQRDA
ncbi:MAG: ABC-F family ATP-binding cassette domain-containing protein [Desulfomicrobium sp.]|nr:ABC-F family ATP-binding cassette domain-containing protein [Pseudomonadota bacterium]MBV1713541.1 ABC-F family ATP-binding cassette domain-containing protein [Desulfomicrobium sp.]MBU4572077.1 ABC-F family ATP-binding cassette domain-containing protein [Pseudomonadota bacterium]MBU4594055.1 ABC-F family ATP-binding cassette domain-containing protein [Pseudomonadota bacterium]MBV1720994.1 ABC-F family ATP-binding cassette domain-containing protein [Desulfomicrobium sp.]